MTRSSSTREIEVRSAPSRSSRACSPEFGRPRFKAEAFDGLFENAALGRIVVDDKDTLCHETLELNTTDTEVGALESRHAVCRYWTPRNRPTQHSPEIARQQ